MTRSTDLERLTICDQPTAEEIAFLEKSLHEYDKEQTHGRLDFDRFLGFSGSRCQGTWVFAYSRVVSDAIVVPRW